MKLNITRTSIIAAAVLAAALTIPVLAAPGGEGSGKGEGWKAHRGGEHTEGRGKPRGPGGPGGPGGPEAGPLGALIGGDHQKALHPFWENEKLNADLKLTDAQIESLTKSHEVTKAALDASKGSVAEAGKALREEMKKDNPDLETVLSLSDKVADEATEKARIILSHVVAVKTTLTTEQEETLKKNGRGAIGDRLEEFSGLREEIREIMQGGGSIADVEALLAEKEIPEAVREMILKRVQHKVDEALSGKGKKENKT